MACWTTASILLLTLYLLSGILNLQTVRYTSGCVDVEIRALLKFKDGLTDDAAQLSSWAGNDCCKWVGVSCDNRTGQVVGLKIHRLGGEINSSLLELKHLNFLDLSMNNFEGTKIPSFIGSFQKLSYLNLSNSSFGGLIPPHLGNLSSLLSLDLELYTTDPIHNDIKWISSLSSLRYLNLAGLDLSKAADYWLQTLNMLPFLIELHLPQCSLSNLPLSLPYANFTKLSVLDLSNNAFNSTIPQWLFNLTGLVHLDLQSNNLYGELPHEIATLTSLKTLDLSQNSYIKDRLPKQLGNLCNLQKLKLSFNKFTGDITDFLDGLMNCTNVKLETLDLGYNDLTGELPDSLGILKNLRYFELWDNSFQGSIPKSIGELSSLEEFYLSNNQMNGDVPETLGKLSTLRVLDLSENPWRGIITEIHLMNLSSLKQLQINNLSPEISLIFNISADWIPPFQLEYLYLRSCQLGPKFPLWLKNQSQLNTVVLNNAGISDIIPQWFLDLNLLINEFDVAYNQLTGKVPNSLKFQSPSTVDLSSNFFSGSLPLWSLNVSKIYLRSNLFSGPIPYNIGELMPLLTDLDISYNSLNGSIPLSIGNLSSLTTLVISNNKLSGKIPEFWNQTPFLYILDMSNNTLSGKIPSSIGSLQTLKFFVLSNNNLYGKLPSSLKNCTLMESLDIGYNFFSGNLPNWIGESMQSLLILRVRNNSFSGKIPSKICTLSNLHILDLSQNNFSGVIPSCVGNLTGFTLDLTSEDVKRYEGKLNVISKGRVLEYNTFLYIVNSLDLSRNNLSGEIPNELMSLHRLWTLNLSFNHMTGNIPQTIDNLVILETLDLSNNEFSGPIPSTMASLTFLAHLDLSYNNLSGRIPSSNQFNTFIEPSIYEGNLELCGAPLKKECTSQSPNANRDQDEEEDGFESVPFLIGMGLGFFVGFWVICGTLVVKQSWRLAYFQLFDNIKDRLHW